MITSRRAALLPAILVIAACQADSSGDTGAGTVTRLLTIESRGADVPATFVRPETGPGPLAPLVVMAHGHGGSRDEAGGFSRLADALARRGVASIRMDFPGCGESGEPFTENNLGNMLADTRAALAFGRSQPGIDPGRTAIVGYSMGGRVAMLSLDDGYDAVALWAPAGTDGPDAMFAFMGGQDGYRAYSQRALAAGSASFVTPWGQQQELGRQWFEDMDTSRPLGSLRAFAGPVLVVYGTADPIVEPAIAAAVAGAAAGSMALRVEPLEGADHGLGFYSDDAVTADRVINATVEFVISHLQQE